MRFSLVVGGGRYGSKAVEYLLNTAKPFVVIDESEKCYVLKNYDLKVVEKLSNKEGRYFFKGGIDATLKALEILNPEYVFTTAPIHVLAALVKTKYNLKEWNEGINYILSGIPFKVVVSVGRGSVVVSYNRDKTCKKYCEAPEICPITKIKKPCPMYELLRFASPDGFILQSYQIKPGLGALKGEEVLEILEKCRNREKVVVGTACKCHGVVTALKK